MLSIALTILFASLIAVVLVWLAAQFFEGTVLLIVRAIFGVIWLLYVLRTLGVHT